MTKSDLFPSVRIRPEINHSDGYENLVPKGREEMEAALDALQRQLHIEALRCQIRCDESGIT